MITDTSDDQSERCEGGSRWARALAWFPWLALMLIVFEVTADPALGVAVGCLKFGLKDFGTARWLRRSDPVRARGRACSWFCATRGILKVGFMAYIALQLGFAVDAICGFGMAAQGAFVRQIMAAVLTILASIALASASAAIGVLIALRGGIKVWIDYEVNRARKFDLWPPYGLGRRGRMESFAGLVVLLAPLGACIVSLAIYFTVGFLMFVDVRDGWQVGALIGGGLAWLVVAMPLSASYLGQRVIATWPWECYYPIE